jgi:hypothetical protein
VPSRVLIGAGALLLGAASATAGSLYAIAQLGQGLVAQPTAQVSVAMVNAELAQVGTNAPATGRDARHSPTASQKAAPARANRRAGGRHRAAPPVTRNPGKLLSSSGGTTIAACSTEGAELLYSSPAQGFEVFRFVRGPSAVASVTFIDSSIGVVMKVTCDSLGDPVAQVSELQRPSWGPHHDDE